MFTMMGVMNDLQQQKRNANIAHIARIISRGGCNVVEMQSQCRETLQWVQVVEAIPHSRGRVLGNPRAQPVTG